jgi:pilus assembly protein CpaC
MKTLITHLLIITSCLLMPMANVCAEEETENLIEYAPGGDIPILDFTKTEAQVKKKLKGAPKVKDFKLTLAIGEAKVIQVPYIVGRHDVTTTGPFEIKIESTFTDSEGNPFSEISVQAIKAGSSTLRLFDKKNFPRMVLNLSASQFNIAQIMSELKHLLAPVEGLQIKLIGEKIILDGEVLVPRDLERVEMVLKQYPMVVNLTRLSPNTQNLYAARMEADIGKPEVKVRANQGKFIIEGVVDDGDEIEYLMKIVQTYIPPIFQTGTSTVKEAKTPTIVNLLGVRPPEPEPPEKIIKLVIHYVELDRAYIRAFNFNWSPLMTENSELKYDFEEGFSGSISGTITNLFPKLGKAVKLNHARILRTATVLVKDKAKNPGSVSSQVKVPFVSGQTQSGDSVISFANVTNNTSVRANIVKEHDQIHMSLNMAVSALVGEGSGGPQTVNNNVSTEVVLGESQSAAVAGLFSESLRRGFERSPDPGGEGTTLFRMGKTKNYSHNRNQFIVFITPEILSSPSEVIEASNDFKRKFRLIRRL